MKASEIFNAGLLSNQVVAVTGGATGIGLAIVEECAALGAKIAIGARNEDRLQITKETLSKAGVSVFTAPLNIRDDKQVNDWVEAVCAHYGEINVLVNNAGGQFPSPAISIRNKGWRAVIDTNLNGTWYMTRATATRMQTFGGGRIINIVANMWRGFPGMAHTGAARAAVVNLTKTLSLEWAKHGILVNAVAPGVIRSSGLDTYPEALREVIWTEAPKQVPLKRMGEVDDVAWAVAYLAGPAGRYITGATLCVDGGQAHWGNVFPV